MGHGLRIAREKTSTPIVSSGVEKTSCARLEGMSNYPRTWALLTELCGLSAAERELPLHLVARLHKGALRQPLLGMVPLWQAHEAATTRARWAGAAGRAPGFRDVLAERHHLSWRVLSLPGPFHDAQELVDHDACVPLREAADEEVRGLLVESATSWQAYDALALLYYASHGLDFAGVAEVVEISLVLVPELHAFALACAQVVPYAPVSAA
jgi:hypothetical protein